MILGVEQAGNTGNDTKNLKKQLQRKFAVNRLRKTAIKRTIGFRSQTVLPCPYSWRGIFVLIDHSCIAFIRFSSERFHENCPFYSLHILQFPPSALFNKSEI